MSNSEHGLQQCLNKLNDYTKKWELREHLKKTKLMIFNKSGWKLKASCSFGSKTVDSRTSPCGHLSNTDTSLLRTVSHVPTKFSYISS